jgi:hypothetical protein
MGKDFEHFADLYPVPFQRAFGQIASPAVANPQREGSFGTARRQNFALLQNALLPMSTEDDEKLDLIELCFSTIGTEFRARAAMRLRRPTKCFTLTKRGMPSIEPSISD